MDVILLESVSHLGGVGDLVRVKSGYARNFLIPSGKALRATEANRARFEKEKEALERLNHEKRTAAEKEADTLRGRKISLIRQAGETGQLYGSVTGKDIVEACSDEEFSLSRNHVILDKPLKALGTYEVLVRLHPEVELTIEVEVKRSEAEENLYREEEEARAEAERKAAESAESRSAESAESGSAEEAPEEDEEADEEESQESADKN